MLITTSVFLILKKHWERFELKGSDFEAMLPPFIEEVRTLDDFEAVHVVDFSFEIRGQSDAIFCLNNIVFDIYKNELHYESELVTDEIVDEYIPLDTPEFASNMMFFDNFLDTGLAFEHDFFWKSIIYNESWTEIEYVQSESSKHLKMIFETISTTGYSEIDLVSEKTNDGINFETETFTALLYDFRLFPIDGERDMIHCVEIEVFDKSGDMTRIFKNEYIYSTSSNWQRVTIDGDDLLDDRQFSISQLSSIDIQKVTWKIIENISDEKYKGEFHLNNVIFKIENI